MADKWEYKVLFGVTEEDLNKWGEEGYEIDHIIPPPPPQPNHFSSHEQRSRDMIVILKRRKP